MCAGKTRGIAYFPVDKLEAIWLLSGAKTDRGVGVGSTRSEVKRAYGKALRSFSDHDNKNSLYVIGPKQANYTPDIVFVVGPTPQSKVDLIGLVVEGPYVSAPPYEDEGNGEYWTGSSEQSTLPLQVFC